MAFGWDDAAIIGSQLLGGILGGGEDPQERNSFARQQVGGVSVDPRNMLAQGKVATEDALSALLDLLEQPINMKTTVNPLPSFTGGGLPMAISAPGMDAARMDPSLLTTPGIKVPRRSLAASPQAPGGPAGFDFNSNAPTSGIGNRIRTAVRATPQPGINDFSFGGAPPQASGSSEFDKALAALQMLKVA